MLSGVEVAEGGSLQHVDAAVVVHLSLYLVNVSSSSRLKCGIRSQATAEAARALVSVFRRLELTFDCSLIQMMRKCWEQHFSIAQDNTVNRPYSFCMSSLRMW